MNRISLLALLSLGACATPGANPHDMSAAHHQGTAAEHDQLAADHAKDYRPGAEARRPPCLPTRRAGLDFYLYDVCWSSALNPTEWHKTQAETHRKHAVDHRAASASLRDAEAKACAGLAEGERELSPFEHSEDVAAVSALTQPSKGGEETVGARVTFKPVEGLTVEWLQRAVDCHLARNAALGHAVPEMPSCPLVPNGAQARVTGQPGSISVEIRASDPAAAREILQRARQLVSPVPSAKSTGK